MKNSNDTIEDRTRDFRLVAKCLNQLRAPDGYVRLVKLHRDGKTEVSQKLCIIATLCTTDHTLTPARSETEHPG